MVKKAVFEWKIQFSNEKVPSDFYRTNHSVALCIGSGKVYQWELVRKGGDYWQVAANYASERRLGLLVGAWKGPALGTCPCLERGHRPLSLPLNWAPWLAAPLPPPHPWDEARKREMHNRDKMEKRDKHYRQTGRWSNKKSSSWLKWKEHIQSARGKEGSSEMGKFKCGVEMQ